MDGWIIKENAQHLGVKHYIIRFSFLFSLSLSVSYKNFFLFKRHQVQFLSPTGEEEKIAFFLFFFRGVNEIK